MLLELCQGELRDELRRLRQEHAERMEKMQGAESEAHFVKRFMKEKEKTNRYRNMYILLLYMYIL